MGMNQTIYHMGNDDQVVDGGSENDRVGDGNRPPEQPAAGALQHHNIDDSTKFRNDGTYKPGEVGLQSTVAQSIGERDSRHSGVEKFQPMMVDDVETSTTPPVKSLNDRLDSASLTFEDSNLKRIPQTPVDDDTPSKRRRDEQPSTHRLSEPMSTNDSIADKHNATLSTESSSPSARIATTYDNIEPSIALIIRDKLEDIPSVAPLSQLTLRDLAELENSLQMGDKFDYSPDDRWKKDWSGNLQFFDKEIVVNRGHVISQPNVKPIKVHFHEMVAQSLAEDVNSLRGLELLFSYVYHMKDTPEMAKRILANALEKPAESLKQRFDFINDAVRRITYDPVVLQQDGWITKKSGSPEGSMGGASLIGQRIIWQRYEGVIIAFTIDENLGALWKAIWDEDLETFDLEADEIQEAMKKWERKQYRINNKKKGPNSGIVVAGSTRNAATARFVVDGIEDGIILALPTKSSRGVKWPARVMHVSETSRTNSGNRRGSMKYQLQVVFLAPYWNGEASSVSIVSVVNDPFSRGPYFEIDTIEVSDAVVSNYPYNTFSVENLKCSFRFLGLPKAMFSRYLDSHRLALALKTYARKYIPKNYIPGDENENAFASASLTESHPLSVFTPMFPSEVLDLPYDYILKKMSHSAAFGSALDDSGDLSPESVIDIKSIIDSMTPPLCFGTTQDEGAMHSPEDGLRDEMILSPSKISTPIRSSRGNAISENIDLLWSLSNFASELLINFMEASRRDCYDPVPYIMAQLLNSLVAQIKDVSSLFERHDPVRQKEDLKRILCHCLLVKGHGEDFLAVSTLETAKTTIVAEWRKAIERVYKRVIIKLKLDNTGKGTTYVITDSRCNGHITADGAYERQVRLPAAIKGAKLAGAGSNPNVILINTVEDVYLDVAKDVIPRAHKMSYIQRLKSKVTAIAAEETGVPLTDDSEGEGGRDTKGSRGSYTAAIVGVAAAIKAVDMVVGGRSTNVFCAIRPPGHHAGSELRPMKALSNGFCLLNSAACAAIYATTSQSQGGLGLRRVCVIDFDLHHGNGTQEILCSTYDPRFLYVSMHAGGAHINGFDDEDSEHEFFSPNPGSKTIEGIFPGRCGDSSPHDGVLNIPLGRMVTTTDIGNAMVSQVTPRVERFSPDLIILSAGFDAHKNDPLGMGRLSAKDFGSLTEVACQMANKSCSGRIMSVLEGGYGVPCCRPRDDIFLPKDDSGLLDLGDDLPEDMTDVVPPFLRQKLDKCHQEGFIHCVCQHVSAFVKFNTRK